MATKRIRLVQGDTRPALIIALTDEVTGAAIDVSDPATFVRVLFRETGDTDLRAVMLCSKLPGYANPDTGALVQTPPYDVPGAGGRVQMHWTEDALAVAGMFEAEIEITFPDGTVQTVYDVLRFQVREQF